MSVRIEDTQWRKFFKLSTKNVKRNSFKFLKVAYNTIGFRDIINHFIKERAPRGRWVRSERAKREGGKTLQDTGNLRKSFSPNNTRKVGNKGLLIFNNANYSAIHDRGSRKNNIPQREFMYFTDRALSRMAKIFLDKTIK